MFTYARDVYKYRDLLYTLVSREYRARFRSSVLGWAWSIMLPLTTTLVYAFVFAVVFKAKPSPGTHSGNNVYLFFLMSAIIPWNFFAASVNTGMASIVGASNLITKVRFPRELIVTSAVSSLAVQLFIELGLIIIFSTIFGFTPITMVPALLLVIVFMLIFTLGIAHLCSAFYVRFRDLQYIMTIVLSFWLYLTPALYPESLIPAHYWGIPLRKVLAINPMSAYIAAFRNCLYDVSFPPLTVWLRIVAWAAISISAGVVVFRRRSRYFAEDL